MVTLLKDEHEKIAVKLADLHELKETGIKDAELAQRPLDQKHVEQLIMSNPYEWPLLIITKTEEFGFIVSDGLHRKEAAKLKGMEEINCTCKPFKDETELIEFTFRANLKHGLKASEENKANYVWWLYNQNRERKQEEIAQIVGITQPSVSEAINRRLKKEAETREKEKQERQAQQTAQNATDQARIEEEQKQEVDQVKKQEQEQKQAIRKYCTGLMHDAVELFRYIAEMDEKTQLNIIIESIADSGINERQRLLTVARLVEKILEPPVLKHPARTRK